MYASFVKNLMHALLHPCTVHVDAQSPQEPQLFTLPSDIHLLIKQDSPIFWTTFYLVNYYCK